MLGRSVKSARSFQDVARRKRGVALEPRPGFEAVSAGATAAVGASVESLTSADDQRRHAAERQRTRQDTIQDTWA